MTLGDLIEGIVLHAFDGKTPFSKELIDKIQDIKKVYELDLDASHSHKLIEKQKPSGFCNAGVKFRNKIDP